MTIFKNVHEVFNTTGAGARTHMFKSLKGTLNIRRGHVNIEVIGHIKEPNDFRFVGSSSYEDAHPNMEVKVVNVSSTNIEDLINNLETQYKQFTGLQPIESI